MGKQHRGMFEDGIAGDAVRNEGIVGRLVEYFKSGIKHSGAIGIELEHFIVDRRSFRPVFFDDECGQKVILEQLYGVLSKKADVRPCFEDGSLIGIDGELYSISLEPAGQLEISIRAFEDLDSIEKAYDDFRNDICPLLSAFDLTMLTLGYAPRGRVRDMRLIPKRRYERMLSHFRKTGKLGENMMKGTASLQVSIDYFSEDDFRRKYRVGMKLMPFLKLLTSNSPFFEGDRNNDPLLRTRIWNETDAPRCSYPDDSLSDSFSFADYAEYACGQEMIYYPYGELREDRVVVRDFFSGRRIDDRDVEFVLSMVFPEIRLKKVLEIRGMDSISLKMSKPILAVIKGIFYNEDSLAEADGNYRFCMEELAEMNRIVSADGLRGRIFGRSVSDMIGDMLSIGMEHLVGSDRETLGDFYRDFYNRFYKKK